MLAKWSATSELIFEREQLLSLARLSVRAREEGRSIVYLPSGLDALALQKLPKIRTIAVAGRVVCCNSGHKSHIDYIVLQCPGPCVCTVSVCCSRLPMAEQDMASVGWSRVYPKVNAMQQ